MEVRLLPQLLLLIQQIDAAQNYFDLSFSLSSTSLQITVTVLERNIHNIANIVITTIFIKPNSINHSIATYKRRISYGTYGAGAYPSEGMITNFGVPINLFGYPASEFNCFIGFTWVDLIFNVGPLTSKLIMSGPDITSTINRSYLWHDYDCTVLWRMLAFILYLNRHFTLSNMFEYYSLLPELLLCSQLFSMLSKYLPSKQQ